MLAAIAVAVGAGTLAVRPSAVGPAEDVVPDGAIPSSIGEPDGPVVTDLAIGRASVAYVDEAGQPVLVDATTGEALAVELPDFHIPHAEKIDFDEAVTYGRKTGVPALMQLDFQKRAQRLKALALYMMERKEELYEISHLTGATRPDSWVDVEGGIGTLFAFVLVCTAVVILRRTEPDRPRPFRVPAVTVVAGLGILSCLLLMAGLPGETWIRLAVWLVLGLALYAGYGRKNARRVRAGASQA